MTALNAAAALRLGAQNVAAVYAGASKVWPPAGPLYAAEVLADSPLYYWRLADATGPVLDEVADAPGVLNGGVVLGADGPLVDTAASFDGVNDYIALPNVDLLGNTGDRDWTIETWLRLAPDAALGVTAVGIGRVASGTPVILVGNGITTAANAGRLRIVIRPDAGNAYDFMSPAGVNYNDDVWRHVALVATTTGARLYVNGAVVLTAPNPPGGVYTINRGGIGALVRNTVTSFWKGGLAEVALYDHALTPERVAAHWAARST